jgi:hypothetical protein
MAAWVNEVDRVIIAITIQVQAVDGFGVEVGGISGADEAVPFGAIISGVQIIQAGIVRTIIAARIKRVLWRPLLRHTYFTIFYARSQEKASQAVMT